MLRAILDFLFALFRGSPDEDETPRAVEGQDPPAKPAVPDSEDEPVVVPSPEPEPEPEPEPDPYRTEPEIEEPGRMKISAWAGNASLNNPERDVAFATSIGLTRLDVIVNDHSGWREPHDFTMRKEAKIEKLVKLAQAAGLEVHFMSWIMPHRQYVEGAAEQLVPLCNRLGITSLQWDAEEPWMKATDAMAYPDAAKLIAEKFKGLDCPMGVNGIGYASATKFGPLADVCEYVVPQCYATSSNTLDPTTCVPKFVRRYRSKFGVNKPVQVGLAAYRQPPKGFTTEAAMAASFGSAEAIEGCDAVIYWSLGWIRKTPSVAAAIKKLATKGQLVA